MRSDSEKLQGEMKCACESRVEFRGIWNSEMIQLAGRYICYSSRQESELESALHQAHLITPQTVEVKGALYGQEGEVKRMTSNYIS